MPEAEAETSWHPPSKPAMGQVVAIDENGEECCAFHWKGRWYLCTNIQGPDYEFQPRAWRDLPRMEKPHG